MIVIAVGEAMHNSVSWFRLNLELGDGDAAGPALRASRCWNGIWCLIS